MRDRIITLLSTGKRLRVWQIAKAVAFDGGREKPYINTRPCMKALKGLEAEGIAELDPKSTGKDKIWRLKRQ